MQKSRFESVNFFTAVLTWVLAMVQSQGIDITLDAGQTILAIVEKNFDFLFTAAIPSLANITFKVVQKIREKTWDWSLAVRSPNFITYGITTLALILGLIGIILPEDAPTVLTNAFLSGSFIAFIGALVTHFINPIIHFIRDAAKPKEN